MGGGNKRKTEEDFSSDSDMDHSEEPSKSLHKKAKLPSFLQPIVVGSIHPRLSWDWIAERFRVAAADSGSTIPYQVILYGIIDRAVRLPLRSWDGIFEKPNATILTAWSNSVQMEYSEWIGPKADNSFQFWQKLHNYAQPGSFYKIKGAVLGLVWALKENYFPDPKNSLAKADNDAAFASTLLCADVSKFKRSYEIEFVEWDKHSIMLPMGSSDLFRPYKGGGTPPSDWFGGQSAFKAMVPLKSLEEVVSESRAAVDHDDPFETKVWENSASWFEAMHKRKLGEANELQAAYKKKKAEALLLQQNKLQMQERLNANRVCSAIIGVVGELVCKEHRLKEVNFLEHGPLIMKTLCRVTGIKEPTTFFTVGTLYHRGASYCSESSDPVISGAGNAAIFAAGSSPNPKTAIAPSIVPQTSACTSTSTKGQSKAPVPEKASSKPKTTKSQISESPKTVKTVEVPKNKVSEPKASKKTADPLNLQKSEIVPKKLATADKAEKKGETPPNKITKEKRRQQVIDSPTFEQQIAPVKAHGPPVKTYSKAQTAASRPPILIDPHTMKKAAKSHKLVPTPPKETKRVIEGIKAAAAKANVGDKTPTGNKGKIIKYHKLFGDPMEVVFSSVLKPAEPEKEKEDEDEIEEIAIWSDEEEGEGEAEEKEDEDGEDEEKGREEEGKDKDEEDEEEKGNMDGEDESDEADVEEEDEDRAKNQQAENESDSDGDDAPGEGLLDD